jgi:phosphopantothenoylcysteine synthetase/decarboxylase
VTLIARDGDVEELPLMSKHEVADEVIERVLALLEARA